MPVGKAFDEARAVADHEQVLVAAGTVHRDDQRQRPVRLPRTLQVARRDIDAARHAAQHPPEVAGAVDVRIPPGFDGVDFGGKIAGELRLVDEQHRRPPLGLGHCEQAQPRPHGRGGGRLRKLRRQRVEPFLQRRLQGLRLLRQDAERAADPTRAALLAVDANFVRRRLATRLPAEPRPTRRHGTHADGLAVADDLDPQLLRPIFNGEGGCERPGSA